MWRHRCKESSRGNDPVVEDARAQRADFERQLDEVREGRSEVDQRRKQAAQLLERSQEALRRNHFAEAIVHSMRRPS